MTPRNLSRWALGTTLLLVAVGGFTRGSGSGFGCEERWPLCEGGLLGGLLPRAEYHMIVEWSHRWLAAVVGLLIVATAVVCWRSAARWIKWTALAAVLAVGVQAWVGRLVVAELLDADLVSLHLGISMSVATLLAIIVVATGDTIASPRDRGWALRLGLGASAVFGVLLLGSLVHNLYIPGWPLTTGELIPDLGDRNIAIHFAHRVAAAAGLVYLLYLAGTARARLAPGRILTDLAAVAYAVNIGLGAAHVFTKVGSSLLVAGHLFLASAALMALVAGTAVAAGAAAPSTAPAAVSGGNN